MVEVNLEKNLPFTNQSGAGHNKKFRRERGAALLVVIWVGAFFAIILSSFAFSMRTELIAAKNFKEKEEAHALARAGVNRAMGEMVNSRKQGDANFQSPGVYDSGRVKLGRGTYQVIVTEEESKISLNGAAPPMLRTLLQNNGVTDPSLLDTIVDSILDWRDKDDLHRLNGAESEYYALLPLPYRPRNGPFEIVEEVLLVKGMTREILYGNIQDAERRAELRARNAAERSFGLGEYLGIYPFLTVHGSGTVNRNTADLEVLVAAGLSDTQAREMILRRDAIASRGVPSDTARPNLLAATGRAYRIESIGRIAASQAAYRIAASVVIEGGRERPRFRVIAWQEGLG